METVSGLSNWRLVVRREENEITILRAVSCDTRAALPETLFGLPVTALSDRALAPKAAPVEGEEIVVTGGAETGEWDNRNIRELTLPSGLRWIGDYAFWNLRAMETLRFTDALETIGSASFMNCRSFSRIELTRLDAGQGPALAAIVQAQPQELDVGIRGADGGLTRLIFPEYRETYTENSPAHHFDLLITGGGYAYHSVFRSKALSLAEYDGLWKNYLAAEHDEDSALRLACYRLRWPTDLSKKARGRYGDYLLAHMGEALAYALTAYDGEMLRLLLSLGEIPEPALSAALDLARSLGRTEATALLLESRHRRAPAGRAKRFEL